MNFCWTFVLAGVLGCGSLYCESEGGIAKTMEAKTNTEPVYLYKILSYRDWQLSETRKNVFLPAMDDPFIHLSTEGQLDGILAKYWAGVPQLVILKIKREQLEGELRLETNPGGSTKYYHLYQGNIPLSSISEAKILYRQPVQSHSLSTIPVVQAGDPVLRKQARELSKEEIVSPEIQQLLKEMKNTMKVGCGVGLAAPQIGRSLQIIVIEDMDHSHLTQEQLVEQNRSQVPFHVVINPRICLEGTETAQFFEGCLSLPGFVGIVPRATAVRVECLNERAEPVVIEARGWYARILQHEIDHLHGVLYIDRAIPSTIMTEANYVTFWKGKKIQAIVDGLQ